jgi:2-oxoglutarate dehydrogenase E2 component (dihydrolipoamide succinyltransferase)
LLVELETDKITLEVPSPATGVLSKIQVPEGETVTVGSILGLIQEGAVATSIPQAEPTPLSPPTPSPASEGPLLMPAAAKKMAEAGLRPDQVAGTGKGGRVLKEDVLRTLAKPAPAPSPVASVSQQLLTPSREEERVPMSRLRQRIAQRLKEAQNTAAILTTINEIDMSGVMALRDRFKQDFEKKHGVKLGFMSFFVKACVAALQELPAVNGEIQGDSILYKNYYDIGVAVGTPQGLVVPIVRNAESLGFSDIEKEIGRLGAKAKDGKLTLEDLSGGTFTISNGGVYGSLLSTPILNPPQSGILGMHSIQKRPVAIGDTVQIRPMMYIALSYDHRIVDGREAVTFLVRIKDAIESPERLMLGL